MICVIRGFHTKFTHYNDTSKSTLFVKDTQRTRDFATFTLKFMSFSIWKIIIESNVSYRWCLRNCERHRRISSNAFLLPFRHLSICDALSSLFFTSYFWWRSVTLLFKSPSMRSHRSECELYTTLGGIEIHFVLFFYISPTPLQSSSTAFWLATENHWTE